jgi:hypothetical protein
MIYIYPIGLPVLLIYVGVPKDERWRVLEYCPNIIDGSAAGHVVGIKRVFGV